MAEQTEAETRFLVAQLQPGDQIVVDHEVKVGQTRWHTETTGEVVETTRRRHSLHFDRNFDDRVWSDMILLRRADGELTTVTVDEFTRVRRAEDAPRATSAATDSPGDTPPPEDPTPAAS